MYLCAGITHHRTDASPETRSTARIQQSDLINFFFFSHFSHICTNVVGPGMPVARACHPAQLPSNISVVCIIIRISMTTEVAYATHGSETETKANTISRWSYIYVLLLLSTTNASADRIMVS